jgi:hypothetical protein
VPPANGLAPALPLRGRTRRTARRRRLARRHGWEPTTNGCALRLCGHTSHCGQAVLPVNREDVLPDITGYPRRTWRCQVHLAKVATGVVRNRRAKQGPHCRPACRWPGPDRRGSGCRDGTAVGPELARRQARPAARCGQRGRARSARHRSWTASWIAMARRRLPHRLHRRVASRV